MVRSLVAASPYHDKQEAAWFKEIENATFEELGRGTSARLQPLDARLAAALTKTLPEQLRIRVQAQDMEAYKNDAAITVRQIVHMMYDWLHTDAHMSTFFSFHDLSQLTWLGDKPADIEKFRQNWDHVLEHTQYTMPPDCLRDLFFRMIEKSGVLREDIAHYRREQCKGTGTPDFSLDYLRRCIERLVEHQRHDQSLQDRKSAYLRNQP